MAKSVDSNVDRLGQLEGEVKELRMLQTWLRIAIIIASFFGVSAASIGGWLWYVRQQFLTPQLLTPQDEVTIATALDGATLLYKEGEGVKLGSITTPTKLEHRWVIRKAPPR